MNKERRIIALNNFKIQAAKIATFFMILCSISYISFTSSNIQPLPEPDRPAKPFAAPIFEEERTTAAVTENKNVNAVQNAVEEVIDVIFEEAEKVKEKIQEETGELSEIKEEIKESVKELSDKIKEKLEGIQN